MTRLDGVSQGNVERAQARRGWLLGHFVLDDPLLGSHELEVKWGVHEKGASKGTSAANRLATTLAILVRGRFRLTFSSGSARESILLQKEGDYALWRPGIHHGWVAEEQSVVVTIRWPSLPDDQVLTEDR